jgi:bifunctional UDP-N-acetylglucosamine pyrophosphorylase / glucosamine-1-phosphate N-acetyltransferase
VEQPAAVILAAGRGKRMKSDLPKVLHPLCGRPMLDYVATAVRQAGARRVFVVVGRDGDKIRNALGSSVDYVDQPEPRGSGHALMQAMPRLRGQTIAFVVYGDMPFVSAHTLRALWRALRGSAVAAVATRTVERTQRFGRIIRDPEGRFLRIVEEEDATPEEAAVREVNAGLYCFRLPPLGHVLRRIRADNRQGEYYLTDALGLLVVEGQEVATVAVEDPEEMLGINTREELAAAESAMRRRILQRIMDGGVTVLDPATTYVDASVRVGRETIIHPGTILSGRTVIGPSCVIGPGARISDSVLGRAVSVRDSSVEGTRIGDGTRVGPYAHLRPGTVIGRNVEIGNYAEMKNARIGDRTKVHHKSYLGDAHIGADVNIGAGTITCNYGTDRRKHRTTIEDGAYIGSDSMLVAPVRVGRGAVTGAGSVVTRNVPARTLVVGVPARVARVLDGARGSARERA